MNEKLPYWGSVLFSIAALVLLVVNIALANANHKVQTDVTQRQNTIASAQALGQINQGLVQAMAEAAVKNNNTALRELLASQEITLKSESPAAETKSAAKPATKK